MGVHPHVAVCIATFQRPDGLLKLLEALAALEWDGELTTIVIDNDAQAKQGLEVAHRLADTFPWELVALIEPQPGIPFPRNAAIAAGLDRGAELLAFIDDDEWPAPDWLQALYSGLEDGAQLAGGPQVPVFPASATRRQRSTSYYGHDQDVPSGVSCQLESSGNFMVSAAALAPHGPPWFDPRYARASGADHDLFRRLERAGAEMRWVPSAGVFEDVPQHRLDDEWLRRRVVEIHNGRVRIDREHKPGLVDGVVRAAKTLALGTQAVAMTLAGIANDDLAYGAKLLRWKFRGKFEAHLGKVTDRVEDRPASLHEG